MAGAASWTPLPPADRWPTVARAARTAEELGFHSIWAYDHALPVPGRENNAAPGASLVFEPLTLLAALAVQTKRLRLGQLVVNAALRPPGYSLRGARPRLHRGPTLDDSAAALDEIRRFLEAVARRRP